MPIGITEEHDALQQAVRGWAERACAPDVPRALLDAESEGRPAFWDALAEQGWLGLHVDEVHGGSGYGLPELVVVLEELGRVVAPGPFLATVLCAAVLQAAGKDIASAYAPQLADGSLVGTVALGGSLEGAEQGDGSLAVSGTL